MAIEGSATKPIYKPGTPLNFFNIQENIQKVGKGKLALPDA